MPDPMAEIGERIKRRTEEDLSSLASVIHDYNSSLRLRRVPDRERDTLHEKQFPFVICQVVAEDGTAVPVMWLSEEEVARPAWVIERLFLSDNKKHGKGGVLARIEAHERAEEVWKQRQIDDETERKLEMLKAMYNTPLHIYRLGKGRKMDLHTGVISNGNA